MVREFPSNNSRHETRIELYEVMPPDLANSIANDPYSQDRFDALPEFTQDHLETLFPDPAEAAALFRMLRL